MMMMMMMMMVTDSVIFAVLDRLGEGGGERRGRYLQHEGTHNA